jgi:hypothetical protein
VDDHHVAHRIASRPFSGEPLVMLREDGAFVGPHREHKRKLALQEEDRRVVVLEGVGPAKVRTVVSPMEQTCFAPMVSSRGDVLFQCLGSGLFLLREGARAPVALGAGTQPSFSLQGDLLVFAVTRDEGHTITASDLVVVDLRGQTPRLLPLASTTAIERSPSLSADGTTLAWLEGDAVMRARLVLPDAAHP